MDAVLDAGRAERAAECAQAIDRQRRALDAPQERRAVRGVQEREGGDVVAAGLAPEQLRVALDAVEERRRERGRTSMPAARTCSVKIVEVAPIEVRMSRSTVS